nr:MULTISPECIES: SpoIIE family protein phosphatase [unclassified Nocardioides]
MTSPRRGSDLGLVVGFGVLAVLVLLSMTTPAQLIAIFAGSAIVASLLTSARRTAVVAGAAVACAFLSATWLGNGGTFDWFTRILLCAVLGLVAVQNAALRERREDRLQRMTVIAETAQRAVLRSIPTVIGSVGLAARYVSATAEAMVGGDLYEVAETPFGVRVIVGDVRGKGLEAVQTATAVLGAFRAAAFTEPDPAAMARQIDATMGRMLDDEEFVTAIVGQFQGDRVTLPTAGTTRRCWCGRGRRPRSTPVSRPCRWAWGRCRRSASTRGPEARGCCSTPTAWSRHVTTAASSSRSTTTPTSSRTAPSRRRWTGWSPTSRRTPAA